MWMSPVPVRPMVPPVTMLASPVMLKLPVGVEPGIRDRDPEACRVFVDAHVIDQQRVVVGVGITRGLPVLHAAVEQEILRIPCSGHERAGGCR
jgi:hypothetical protein